MRILLSILFFIIYFSSPTITYANPMIIDPINSGVNEIIRIYPFLLLPILPEILVYFIAGFRKLNTLLIIVIINIITIPLANLIYAHIGNNYGILFIECIVILIEALIIYCFNKDYNFKKILLTSILANVLSFLFGILIIIFFGLSTQF